MKALYFRFFVLFQSILLAFVCFTNGADNAGAAYQAKDPAAVRMNAAVVSDLHASNEVKHERSLVLEQLFSGISKSKSRLNALVLPGDLTNNGGLDEYGCLTAILKRYRKADNLIAAIGNHDARGDMDKEDYAKSMAGYYSLCKSMGIETDKPYWSKTVEGYYFIVLGSEDEVKDRAYISDDQIAWLDGELTKAEATGKPAFIVCHQVIDHTNNVDNSWFFDGSIGEQSDAVRDAIRRHTDNGLTVLFISGHLHEPFGAHSFEQPWPNLYCLNMPTAQYNDPAGVGCTVEAYKDRVLIRTRNFITGEWLPDEYEIPLG